MRELVYEGAIPGLEAVYGLREGPVEPSPPLCREADFERRGARGVGRGQSSIPEVGDDGTAISRDGMRPAR